jgi:glycosyltransferase involved in cell wall biosynthesis
MKEANTGRRLSIHLVGLKGVPATFGGVEHVVEEVGARLAERGHTVTVHCRTHYTRPQLEHHRGMILRRESSIRTKRLDTLSHTFVALLQAMRERPDIIGLHNYPNGPLALLGRMARTAVVLHLHGFEWGLDKWNSLDKAILKLLLKPATWAPAAITSVSREQTEIIRRVSPRPVFHIPNGVAPPLWIDNGGDPSAALRQLGLRTDDYILCVSRLVPQKGVEYLIRAYRSGTFRSPLIIVGDHNHAPEYAASLRREAHDDSRIRFLGYRYGDELWSLYAGCRLFVLPTESEGMPLVLLEAMAARCPILSSRLPEIEDVGRLSISYFLPKDEDDLRLRMQELIEDDERRRSLASAAGEWVRRHYSWNRIADAYEDLYRKIASRRS